jgi:hypothetical protein
MLFQVDCNGLHQLNSISGLPWLACFLASARALLRSVSFIITGLELVISFRDLATGRLLLIESRANT